jgi:hypothetical protein
VVILRTIQTVTRLDSGACLIAMEFMTLKNGGGEYTLDRTNDML